MDYQKNTPVSFPVSTKHEHSRFFRIALIIFLVSSVFSGVVFVNQSIKTRNQAAPLPIAPMCLHNTVTCDIEVKNNEGAQIVSYDVIVVEKLPTGGEREVGRKSNTSNGVPTNGGITVKESFKVDKEMTERKYMCRIEIKYLDCDANVKMSKHTIDPEVTCPKYDAPTPTPTTATKFTPTPTTPPTEVGCGQNCRVNKCAPGLQCRPLGCTNPDDPACNPTCRPAGCNVATGEGCTCGPTPTPEATLTPPPLCGNNCNVDSDCQNINGSNLRCQSVCPTGDTNCKDSEKVKRCVNPQCPASGKDSKNPCLCPEICMQGESGSKGDDGQVLRIVNTQIICPGCACTGEKGNTVGADPYCKNKYGADFVRASYTCNNGKAGTNECVRKSATQYCRKLHCGEN